MCVSKKLLKEVELTADRAPGAESAFTAGTGISVKLAARSVVVFLQTVDDVDGVE